MLQQQQEELERIRQQQILEQEQEREKQRMEAERLEEEQLKLALSTQQSYQSNHPNGLGRQRRQVPTVVKGRGVAASRIPARPNTTSTGPSRVGPGGGVRKLAGRLVMKRMVERLPLRYREEVRECWKESLDASSTEVEHELNLCDGFTLETTRCIEPPSRRSCDP